MEKEYHCSCTTGCHTYRCSCLRHHEPCDEKCGCVGCRNPLNGVDVEHLTVCAIHNIDQVKALTDEQLEERQELPCGHGSVPLQELLGHHTCEECGAYYCTPSAGSGRSKIAVPGTARTVTTAETGASGIARFAASAPTASRCPASTVGTIQA